MSTNSFTRSNKRAPPIIFDTIDEEDISISDYERNLEQENSNQSVLRKGEDAFKWFWRTNERYTNFSSDSFPSIINLRKDIGDKPASDIQDSENLVDILNKGSRISFFFHQCHMTNCFDFSRCPPNQSLKVNIVPSKIKTSQAFQEEKFPGESNIIYRNLIKIIKDSVHYEPDPSKACIFVPEDDTLDRDPLSPSYKNDLNSLIGPQNSYGINYLIFNLYSGTWPDYKENDFSGINPGAAIIAKASASSTYHRRNFDISIPLFSYLHPLMDTSVKDETGFIKNLTAPRNIFFSFKGKRYLLGRGSDTRNSLYHIDNRRDVVMLTTCKHGKKWKEARDEQCDRDDARYDSYDFVTLMQNSTFCLVPRGRRLGSFRHLEAMSQGCIPVILSDGWVKPFDELIDWSCATLHFEERFLLLVPDLLRDIDKETINMMRNCNMHLYQKHLMTVEKITMTTLNIIEKRIRDYHNQ